ncbi:hypothetical protein INT45_005300 [Circinella minor]|uniref:OTU domain-containing protein n=1 Tax=Circinella minor TaxID=1195481 RepID=A0A8H7SAT0_9FUNG|nr:hypothetical protein INT45_005300 [Circinella minor]
MYNTDIIGHEDNDRSRMETDSDSDMDNEQLIKEAVQNKNKKIQESDDDQEDIKEAAKAKSHAHLEKRKQRDSFSSLSNINGQVVQDPEREKLFREIRLLPRSPDDLTRRLNFPSEAGEISGLYSPASDGNCGWRAAAYNLYDDESA